jgi:hypothetical protein
MHHVRLQGSVCRYGRDMLLNFDDDDGDDDDDQMMSSMTTSGLSSTSL